MAEPEPAKTVKAEAGASGPYRTRGLRLSSKFLSAATDADIGDEEGETGTAAPIEGDEEEADEQQFYDEGGDDDESFSGSADEDDEEAEEFVPSKKRRASGGGGGGGGARGAQPQKKSLTLRQKYMQEMMRR